jgi:hypothetical protein
MRFPPSAPDIISAAARTGDAMAARFGRWLCVTSGLGSVGAADNPETVDEPAPASPSSGAPGTWWWVYFAIFAITLSAHLPEFLGWVTCNPIYSHQAFLAAPMHRLFPGHCSMDDNDGTTLQALGGRAAEMWLSGRLPWWNSYAGLGLPLAAEAQPAAFFLPFVLLLHFDSGIVLLKLVMQLLAGAFALALFRELGLRREAACVGAILFSLNGSFAWFAHSPILPIPFLPGLLFGLERCRTMAAGGRHGGPLWVAIALSLSILAGFPETAFMDGLLAAVWTIVATARTPPGQRGTLITKILVGACIGLALSAPAWISFMDYLRIAYIGVHLFVPESYLTAGQAAALLLPSIYGPPYADHAFAAWAADGGYFGTSLTLLALLGLISGRRHAMLRWAMAGWLVLWLSVLFRAPLAHEIWTAAKPLNEVAMTRYAIPSLEFAAAVLAALAVDDWCRARYGVHVVWAALIFAGVTIATLWLAARTGRLSFGSGTGAIFLVATLLEAAVIVAIAVRLMGHDASRRGILVMAGLVALDATTQFMLPELAGFVPNRLVLKPIEFLRAHAGLSRVFALNEQLPVNYGSWFGVPSIQADSVPSARDWDNAAEAIGGDINLSVRGWLTLTPVAQLSAFRRSIDKLRFAGTRFVVVATDKDPFVVLPEHGMAKVYEDSGTRIYELTGAAPYFETGGGPCQIIALSREHVQTQCATPSVLLRRELRLSGWRASVNGNKAPIGPGGGVSEFFQQVPVPMGHADIRWQYVPPHAGLMEWALALGLAGAGLLAATGIRNDTRRAPDPGSENSIRQAESAQNSSRPRAQNGDSIRL